MPSQDMMQAREQAGCKGGMFDALAKVSAPCIHDAGGAPLIPKERILIDYGGWDRDRSRAYGHCGNHEKPNRRRLSGENE